MDDEEAKIAQKERERRIGNSYTTKCHDLLKEAIFDDPSYEEVQDGRSVCKAIEEIYNVPILISSRVFPGQICVSFYDGQGWHSLRFNYDQIKSKPYYVKNLLRHHVFSISCSLNRRGGV